MNVLSIENLGKTLKDEPLFSKVTFGLDEGEKVGLIGANGTGKTTFLSLIAGLIPPDEGKISINRQTKTILLTQQVEFSGNDTIKTYLESAKEEKPERYAKECEIFLAELKVGESPDTPMRELSGGTRKKVSLARLFALQPTLILMDEPTNHLDIPTISWLENKLRSSQATLILVTHDRYFLNNVCSRIIEIDQNRVFLYEGNYTDFLTHRAQRYEAQNKQQERLRVILRRELEWLKRGPKARTGKDSGRKDRISEMLDEQKNAYKEKQAAEFSSITRRLGKKILEIEHVYKAFGEKKVLNDFSFSFVKGQKIGIVGANGCGKSTMLDVLTGALEPDSGTVDCGVNTFFGYYDQNSRNLPLTKGVLEYISDISEHINMGAGYVVSAAKFLEIFGFDKSYHRLPINVLSGGEKRRLYLISTLVSNPNFLVLDEPTNDLDIQTIRRLEQYIIDFEGCVVEVSHDRAFLDQTCSRLLVFEDGQTLRDFEGNWSTYSEYAERKLKESMPEKENTGSRIVNRTKKGLSFKESRRLEEVTALIERCENEKAELEASFADPDPALLQKNSKRYAEVGGELESLYCEWEDLASRA